MNKEDQAIEEMKIASNLDPLTRVYSLQIGQFLLYGGVIKMRSSN